ncbi:MAG: S41 family peptidase [Phycisphaerales bacterium]|nr:S41 family peptidase [Phycisphaerales bacterium]
MRLRSRNPQFMIAALFLLMGTGCIATGPEIDRYRPPDSMAADDAVSEWSARVWQAARAGETDDTIGALRSPPELEPSTLEAPITSAIDRFVRLEQAAVSARILEVDRLLSGIEPTTLDSSTADRLSLVADLRAAGLPLEADQRAAVAIEGAIDAWVEAAEEAEAASRFREADDAWNAVSDIAIGSDRPMILVESRRRQRRLNSLQRSGPAAARSDGFGTERPTIDDAMRAFAAILKFHVDSPTWKRLCDSGFAQIAEAIPVLLKDAKLTEGEAAVVDARDSFELATAGIEARPGTLPSRVRRALKSSLESIGSDYAPTPLRPSVVARLFLDGVIAATDLRTSAFFGPQADQVRRQLEATYVGIGVEIRQTPEGLFLRPISGSPAARAGLRGGDRLLAVDGTDVRDRSSDSVVGLVSGPVDTAVRLTLSREGVTEGFDLDVTREEVEREAVLGWRQNGVDDENRPIWDWLIDPDAGIAFISIREFREDVIRRFRTAFREASDTLGADRSVAALILDLRDDPGGLRWVAEDLLDLFVSNGTIFSAEGRRAKVRSHSASSFSTRLEQLPVVVLVNGSSASASEIVAGTLQAVGGAVVVGERTHGKGSVQTVRTLFNNGYAFVTESWFSIPDGRGGRRMIDRYRAGETWGVEPDLPVGATASETMEIMSERGRWHSGRGLDAPRPDDLQPSLATTNDRELLLAVALLRARLLPTAVSREQKLANEGRPSISTGQ